MKKEPAAVKQQKQQYPVAPQAAGPAARQPPVPPFDFSTYSPDDLVTLAQQGKGGPGSRSSGGQAIGVQGPAPAATRPKLIHLPPSKAMTQKQQPPQPDLDAMQAATAGVAGLGISHAAEGRGAAEGWQAPSTSTAEAAVQDAVQRVCSRRRMAEYTMEHDLARCAVCRPHGTQGLGCGRAALCTGRGGRRSGMWLAWGPGGLLAQGVVNRWHGGVCSA